MNPLFDNVRLSGPDPELHYSQTDRKTGEVKNETRFFISSLEINPEKISKSIREHWYIENKLHWVLDVVYGEEDSRMRMNFAPHNASAIKKIALNILKLDDTFKKSIKMKQKKALINQDYLKVDKALVFNDLRYSCFCPGVGVRPRHFC